MRWLPYVQNQIQDGGGGHIWFHESTITWSNITRNWWNLIHGYIGLGMSEWKPNQTHLYKSKMAATAILNFAKSCITRPFIVQFWGNLKCSTNYTYYTENWWKRGFCATSKMAAAAILDFIKSHITQPIIFRFWRNLKRSTNNIYSTEKWWKRGSALNSRWPPPPSWISQNLV